MNTKNFIRKLPPVTWVLENKKQIEDKHFAKLRSPYIPQLESLLSKETSIISSNCLAGRIMQDLLIYLKN